MKVLDLIDIHLAGVGRFFLLINLLDLYFHVLILSGREKFAHFRKSIIEDRHIPDITRVRSVSLTNANFDLIFRRF